MGKNAQFRKKIERQKRKAQDIKERIQRKREKSTQRINRNLVSHKYSDTKKTELREFERRLLNGRTNELEI